MGQIQLRICRIAGVALYSTKSEHPLPQRPDQFYVLYFIYVAVVLPLVNKSLFHSDQLFCNHVGCKGKGKSKKSPSFLFPKFHAISSFCIWWIRYSSSRHSQKRIFDAFRCFAALFAHKMALPSYPSEFRFSCKHGI